MKTSASRHLTRTSFSQNNAFFQSASGKGSGIGFRQNSNYTPSCFGACTIRLILPVRPRLPMRLPFSLRKKGRASLPCSYILVQIFTQTKTRNTLFISSLLVFYPIKLFSERHLCSKQKTACRTNFFFEQICTSHPSSKKDDLHKPEMTSILTRRNL